MKHAAVKEEMALALGARCTHLPRVSAFEEGAEQMSIFILAPTRALPCISHEPALTRSHRRPLELSWKTEITVPAGQTAWGEPERAERE